MANSRGASIVDHFYAVESGETGEGPYVSFSITIPARDWAMYKALADRFGTTIKSLVGSNLMGTAEDMFMALSADDKQKAIEASQGYYHEQLKKAGVSETDYDGKPSSPWAQYLSNREYLEAQGLQPEDVAPEDLA